MRAFVMAVVALALVASATSRVEAQTDEVEQLEEEVEETKQEIVSLDETEEAKRRAAEGAMAAELSVLQGVVADTLAQATSQFETRTSEVVAETDAQLASIADARAETEAALARLEELETEFHERRIKAQEVLADSRRRRTAAGIATGEATERRDTGRRELTAMAVAAYINNQASSVALQEGDLNQRHEVTRYADDLVGHRLAEIAVAEADLSIAIERRRRAEVDEVAARQEIAASTARLATNKVDQAARVVELDGLDAERATVESDRNERLLVIESERSAEEQRVNTELSVGKQTLDDQLAEEQARLDETFGPERDILADQLIRQETALQKAKLEDRLTSAAPTARNLGELDFPAVVLDAFVRAAAAHRGCGIRWQVLAGVSKVESGHGRFNGSGVGGDGTTTKLIIGIPLDGNGVALIRDTDGGVLDLDTEFDRAVGPMQFIPSSWRIFGRDGNGDGFANPHNYYDAALAAASLLCRYGPGLENLEPLTAALFRYNRSSAYGQLVLAWALGYDRFRADGSRIPDDELPPELRPPTADSETPESDPPPAVAETTQSDPASSDADGTSTTSTTITTTTAPESDPQANS